jgi:hypothetical protein
MMPTYTLSRIGAAMVAFAVTSFCHASSNAIWTTPLTNTSGPPYPTSVVQHDAWIDDPNTLDDPNIREMFKTSLSSVTVNGTPRAAHLAANNNFNPMIDGPSATNAFTDLVMDDPNLFNGTIAINYSFTLTLPGSLPVPLIDNPDLFDDPNQRSFTLAVDYQDPAISDPNERNLHHILTGMIPTGMAFHFTDVQVTAMDGEMQLALMLMPDTMMADGLLPRADPPANTLIAMTLSGEFTQVPEPGIAALLAIGALAFFLNTNQRRHPC